MVNDILRCKLCFNIFIGNCAEVFLISFIFVVGKCSPAFVIKLIACFGLVGIVYLLNTFLKFSAKAFLFIPLVIA